MLDSVIREVNKLKRELLEKIDALEKRISAVEKNGKNETERLQKKIDNKILRTEKAK